MISQAGGVPRPSCGEENVRRVKYGVLGTFLGLISGDPPEIFFNTDFFSALYSTPRCSVLARRNCCGKKYENCKMWGFRHLLGSDSILGAPEIFFGLGDFFFFDATSEKMRVK